MRCRVIRGIRCSGSAAGDPKVVGICVISWVGYLTSMCMGVDDRFRFAVPIYGCGFLGEQSAWEGEFEKLGAERARKWLKWWDPSNYIPKAKLPTLWVTGSNDFAYNLRMVNDSCRVHGGRPMLSVGCGNGIATSMVGRGEKDGVRVVFV